MVTFFDTNVLVYLADNRDARKQKMVMLAAAERVGAKQFYSEDLNDGQVYCGIKAVNPFENAI